MRSLSAGESRQGDSLDRILSLHDGVQRKPVPRRPGRQIDSGAAGVTGSLVRLPHPLPQLAEQAVVDVGWLEVARGGLGQVAGESAERGGRRQRLGRVAGAFEREVETDSEAGRGGLQIPFDAGDLAGETEVWRDLQAIERIEVGRRVDEGVA